MILQYNQVKTLTATVDYGDIKKGDTVTSYEYVETPKGSCDFHKVTPEGSDKIHYLFTHEVTE